MAPTADNANKAGKTFRVPSAVRESIEASLSEKAFIDPLDVHHASAIASGSPVGAQTITWLQTSLSALEEKKAHHGGTAAQNWASKFSEKSLTASAGFTIDDDLEYYGVGPDEQTPEAVNRLIALDEDDILFEWADGTYTALTETLDDFDAPSVLEISDEDAQALAEWIDSPDKEEDLFILTDIDLEERNLVEMAYGEIDWDEIERLETITADATGYSPIERSANATRQQRAGDGTFGGPQAEKTDTLTSLNKARLPEGFSLLPDPAQRIEQYITSTAVSDVEPTQAPEEDEPESVLAAARTDLDPLYFAIVDSVDTTAVLDVVSIVPDEDGSATAWIRQDGEWVSAPDLLLDLQGSTPPPVVELDNAETVKEVLAQVDAHDEETGAAREKAEASSVDLHETSVLGLSMPGGKHLIRNVEDLKTVVATFADETPDDERAHVIKRARALNRMDLLPLGWKNLSAFNTDHMSPLYGEYGEILVAAAGQGNAETLRRYWSAGKGAAKIRWGTKGDLTRCHRQLNKYMPGRAWGYCQNLHQRIFGVSNAKRDKAVGDS